MMCQNWTLLIVIEFQQICIGTEFESQHILYLASCWFILSKAIPFSIKNSLSWDFVVYNVFSTNLALCACKASYRILLCQL